MKDHSSLFILLLIIIIITLVGILFLRKSGILSINKSTNENSNSFIERHYEPVNEQNLPNVQNSVDAMQAAK